MEALAALVGLAALSVVLFFLKSAFVAAAVVLETCLPGFTGRVYNVYENHPRRAFFVGLINLVASLVLIVVFLNVRVLVLFGVALLLTLVALIVCGYAAGYHYLGRRLAFSRPEDPPARAVLLGGITAEAAFLVPFFGQVFSLLVLLRGLGAVVLTILGPRAGAVGSPDTP